MENIKKISAKEKLQINRQKMPEQSAAIRIHNFNEVNLGLPEHIAMIEAQRCLHCKEAKCITGCPVMINIPRFIKYLSEGDLAAAAESLLSDNALPAITGRVCPQETQCEMVCIRGLKGAPVAIGYLERYVADWYYNNMNKANPPHNPPSGCKVAIIGSGPAGLTAAGELARLGHEVTIYEALHQPGGVLVYGIPEFRLPKKIVAEEVNRLKLLGVKIECDVVIGRTYTLNELQERFDAVFIANGAGLPIFMDIPGENLKGVYSANEYLTRVNLMRAYKFPKSPTPVIKAKKVATIGGGNVAMDSARTAKRMGAEVSTIVYRRTKAEMPARAEEIHHAEEEGIKFEFLAAPIEIIGDDKNWVKALRCQRMKLGEPDTSSRRSPVPIPGSEFILECDVVIVAIGTRANPLLTTTCPELKVNKRGYIKVDENGMTNIQSVFAGGDIVRGAATVILAMGDGKKCARSINKFVRGKKHSK